MLELVLPGIGAALDSAGRPEESYAGRVEALMAVERERLADPSFLERDVIKSGGEFSWDFDVLDAGFLRIAAPYLSVPTGIGALYLRVLEELGGASAANEHGVLILEFMHLATRINDVFNFHDELSKEQPDLRVCEELVQLRYTAQFLNNYPRYTIIENRYETSPENRVRLHRWGTNVFTTVGMSRAAFVKWCHRGFADVPLDHYRQNTINAWCEYVMSPVSVAMILCDLPDDVQRRVRRAFSWFELAAGIACERRALSDPPDAPAAVEACLLPITFPGYLLLKSGRSLNAAPEPGGRFAPVRRAVADAVAIAREEAVAEAIEGMRAEENRCLERFQEDLDSAAVSLPIATALCEAVTDGAVR